MKIRIGSRLLPWALGLGAWLASLATGAPLPTSTAPPAAVGKNSAAWQSALKSYDVLQKKIDHKCHSEIALALDPSSFSRPDAQREKPTRTCDPALAALESLCVEEDARRVVKSKIRQVECRFEPTASKPEMSLKDGKLVIAMHEGMHEAYDRAKDWLMHHL